MKNLLSVTLIPLLIGCLVQISVGQSTIDTIKLNRGEILDLLLISQNPNTNEELKSYFKTALPIGQRMTFKSLPSFKVTNHIQGNHKPELVILGKWNDLEIREKFLTEVVKEVPDFDLRRRTIWSYFGLRYYEIKKNITFTIDRNKYHVASAFWFTSTNKSSTYLKKWKKEVVKSGGKFLLDLKGGKSPFGYQYNPEHFFITSWESETAFQNFKEKLKSSKLDNIEQINELILE